MNVIQPYISTSLKQTLNDIYQSIAPHFESNTNLINHKLLEKINLGLKNYNTGYSDVSLGLSLREMGINNINSTLFNSQPPSNYGYSLDDIKNYISFHYIKTEDDMKKMLEKL